MAKTKTHTEWSFHCAHVCGVWLVAKPRMAKCNASYSIQVNWTSSIAERCHRNEMTECCKLQDEKYFAHAVNGKSCSSSEPHIKYNFCLQHKLLKIHKSIFLCSNFSTISQHFSIISFGGITDYFSFFFVSHSSLCWTEPLHSMRSMWHSQHLVLCSVFWCSACECPCGALNLFWKWKQSNKCINRAATVPSILFCTKMNSLLFVAFVIGCVAISNEFYKMHWTVGYKIAFIARATLDSKDSLAIDTWTSVQKRGSTGMTTNREEKTKECHRRKISWIE